MSNSSEISMCVNLMSRIPCFRRIHPILLSMASFELSGVNGGPVFCMYLRGYKYVYLKCYGSKEKLSDLLDSKDISEDLKLTLLYNIDLLELFYTTAEKEVSDLINTLSER
jgi:hypothetical protein